MDHDNTILVSDIVSAIVYNIEKVLKVNTMKENMQSYHNIITVNVTYKCVDIRE